MDKLEELRLQISSRNGGKESFNAGIKWIESLSEEERRAYFAECIKNFEDIPKRKKRPYYKVRISENKDAGYCIIMIFWSPGGETRPHMHSDSRAEIKVLMGTLVQTNFTLLAPRRNGSIFFIGRTYNPENETINEYPGSIHSVKNYSKHDWAVSLHLFMPELTEMEVYNFEENWHCTISGDADTYTFSKTRPRNAVPIWG